MFNSSDKRPAWHNWRFLFRDLGCDKTCLGRATDTQGGGDHGKTPLGEFREVAQEEAW